MRALDVRTRSAGRGSIRDAGLLIAHLLQLVVGGGVRFALEVDRRTIERACRLLLCVMVAERGGLTADGQVESTDFRRRSDHLAKA